jgi:hypothetical protein
MKLILFLATFALGFPIIAENQTANRESERPRQGKAARKMGERFEKDGPKPGQAAPDFELKTVDGKTIRASELWKQKPTVIMTASFTCPVFRDKVPPLEKLTKEFGERVHFLLVYTLEAHPKGEPSPYFQEERVGNKNIKEGLVFPQPKSMEERVEQATKCQASIQLDARMVIDTMDNKTWKAYGSAPNAAYLVGIDGKIVEQQGWFDPSRMQDAISSYIKSRTQGKAGEEKK